jgi:hypothetical protein
MFYIAAPITECTTKRQQRSVIRFVWSEGVKIGKTYFRMKFQYCDKCVNQREVEWVERFVEEWTSVDGNARVKVKEQIHQRVRNNRIIYTDETACILSIRDGKKWGHRN